jgi:pimeloyl-ACP methyl ester carboxylesterase
MRTISFLLGVFLLAACGGNPDEHVGAQQQADSTGSGYTDIVTKDHFVTVSNGATLHVVEKYSPSALAHGRRRAILMLPATFVTNIIWNANVPGHPEYNALARAAARGYAAYSLDYEGYGQSTRPADGKSVTAERLLQDSGDLVRWIRHQHHGAKVDVLGSSLGSSVAFELGSLDSPIPRGWIGHVVLTANVYKAVTPLAAQLIFSPPNFDALSGIPGGYVPTAPPFYGIILAGAEAAAADYCYQNCPGIYAVGPTLEGWALPVFDAHRGRAPLLQFWGDHDLITPFSDAQQFQAEYGGSHSLVVLNGGAHVPQWESVRDQFWADTFAFLGDDDGDEEHDGCDGHD